MGHGHTGCCRNNACAWRNHAVAVDVVEKIDERIVMRMTLESDVPGPLLNTPNAVWIRPPFPIRILLATILLLVTHAGSVTDDPYQPLACIRRFHGRRDENVAGYRIITRLIDKRRTGSN